MIIRDVRPEGRYPGPAGVEYLSSNHEEGHIECEPNCGTMMAVEPVSKFPVVPSELRTFVANWDVVTTCADK
jgi:hypothetical protein